MKMKKLLFLGTAIASLSIVGCNNQQQEPDKHVSVYILSGQSNMEGSTFYDNNKQWLKKALETLEITDADDAFTGVENVYTSYYGYYPYGGPVTPHASNTEDPLAGKFLETKVGMGNNDNYMGPEIGLSYKLKEYATEDNPIFFIKCAFSGSGFSSQNPNWKTRNNTDDLYYKLKTFTHNNLDLIEEEGYIPVIEGFLWHQGESDANNDSQTNNYKDGIRALVNDVRTEFADYALDGDGDNIAFIDADIYDGANTPYGAVTKLNQIKHEFADSHENNYCLDISCKSENGLALQIGNVQREDIEGGYDIYHYKTKDMFILGEAYADVIIDNGLYY